MEQIGKPKSFRNGPHTPKIGYYIQKFELLLVLSAVGLSPFWFLIISHVNLGVFDLLILLSATLAVLRTKKYQFPTSGIMFLGIGLFLFAGLLSLIPTPRLVVSLLHYSQYIFIFLILFPTVYTIMTEKENLWSAFIILTFSTNIVLSYAVITFILTDQPVYNIYLWYGNQNQVLWIISSAVLLNISLSMQHDINTKIRILSLVLGIVGGIYVLYGLSFTSYIMVGGGVWILVFYFITKLDDYKMHSLIIFSFSNAIALLTTVMVLVTNWQSLSPHMSLDSRGAQYQAALDLGIESPLFGVGFKSTDVILADQLRHTSIHNYFLAYFAEIGIVGAIGFTIILLAWYRSVFILLVDQSRQVPMYVIGIICIFLLYTVVILFQPVPVRRFWWIVFAMGWAATHTDSFGTVD